MRQSRTIAGAIGVLLFIAVAAASAQPAATADSYCPNPAHAEPAKTPPGLAASVAKAFQIDETMAREASYVRCVGAALIGCVVGANLDCFKADTRRALPGATAWCRDNPNAETVPMAATCHATIYEWSCKKGRAVAGKALVKVDPQGFIADNWKLLH
jgi:hypothetical protein